jgi:predicted negative regulator of RcsB-dependent stress response
MTGEYLTDDEQLEEVKRIATEYAPWIISAVVLGLGFVYGYRYYEGHQNERGMQAATQFAAMTSAIERNDPSKARQIAGGLLKDYPGSPYADQAQLALARLSIDEGLDANAIAPLTQVMDNSKDSELRHIARLRLARVLIDQGKPDDALKTLSDDPGAFAGQYHEVRGDAFFAKKDLHQAGEEYKTALGEGAARNADSALLTLKIADLGLPPTPAAPGGAAASVAPAESSNKARP